MKSERGSRCRSKACKAPILWAETPEGTRIPLDQRAPVYRIVAGRAVRADDCYVSHFSVCKAPDQFSRSRKKGQ